MDRVAQLDLQECLHAATSSGAFDLKESHLKVRCQLVAVGLRALSKFLLEIHKSENLNY